MKSQGEDRLFSGKRRLAAGASILLALSLLAGCAPAGQSGQDENSSSSTLVVNRSVSQSTLDPALSVQKGDYLIQAATYTRLVRYGTKEGPEGAKQVDYEKIEPYLAKSWEVSDDLKTYTFHLDDSFTFEDGTPIDAEAVKYSFERIIAMNGGGLYYINNGQYDPPLFESIETDGPNTVIFKLSVGLQGLLQNWAQTSASIVDPKVVDANGGVEKDSINTWMAGHVAGGGGFYRLVDYEPGVRAVLEANPDNKIGTKSEKIIVNYVSDPATLALNARSGDADVTIEASPAVAADLSDSESVRVLPFPSPAQVYFGFNHETAPGNNSKLREALSYATPYDGILNQAIFGYGELFFGPIIPTMAGFNAGLSAPRELDLDKARRLIKESGLETPIKLTVALQSGEQSGAIIGPIIKDQWSQIGVELTLKTLSSSEYVTATQKGTVQAYIRKAGPGVPTPSYYLGYSMRCGVPFNLTHTCDEQLDQWLDESISAPLDQQQDYWDKITTRWRELTPRINFFAVSDVFILKDSVKDFTFSPQFQMINEWG